MNDVPDTELFSAYLDGELTADEQVRVEQILAASPEARQLLEELRALDNTLQGLPRERLDEDLAGRVLQVAERRMLLPDAPGDKPSAGRAADALHVSDADSPGWLGIPWRGMFSKRALIWSGVIVATAIIISYTSPPPPKPNRDLAKRDDLATHDQEPAAGASAAPREQRIKRSNSDGSWVGPAGPPRKPPSDDRLAMGEGRRAAEGQDGGAGTETGRARRDNGELKSDLAMHDDAGSPAKSAGEKAVDEVVQQAPSNNETRQAEAVLEKDKSAAPSAAPASSKPGLRLAEAAKPAAEPPVPPAAKSFGFSGRAEGAPNKSGAKEVVAKHSAKDDETTQGVINNANLAGTKFNSLSAGARAADGQKAGQDLSNRAARQMAPVATFVRFDVSALAVRNKVFENLLAYNGLDQSLKNAVQNAVAGSVHLRADQMGQGAGRGNQSMNTQNTQQLPQPMIYEFDASPRQLAIIIEQIRAKSDSFSAPKIEPGVALSYGAFPSGQSQQAKSAAGGLNLSRENVVQSQAVPAPAAGAPTPTASRKAGAAKQHVVFILNVVDGLAPAAGSPSQLPAKQ